MLVKGPEFSYKMNKFWRSQAQRTVTIVNNTVSHNGKLLKEQVSNILSKHKKVIRRGVCSVVSVTSRPMDRWPDGSSIHGIL